jgi:SM-20-related protein
MIHKPQLGNEHWHIFDDLVPSSLYQALIDASLTLDWQFGWMTPSNPNMRYWHHEVGYGMKHNTDDVSDRVDKHPIRAFSLYKTWLQTHLLPAGSSILRFYLNGHTFGSEGWPHIDSDRPGEVTIVLYLNSEWKPHWGGETVLFDANGDISSATLPRPNRLLCFPANQLHAPRPVSKTFDDLRVVLVVKVALPTSSETEQWTVTERTHLDYLEQVGSQHVGHSGRTLLTHLVGTYRILRKAGAADHVCTAGLFHSVYGTSIMHCTLPLDRESVRARIGHASERLAWLFCVIDRPRCWASQSEELALRDGSTVRVSAQELAELRQIERANMDEQGIVAADTR